MLILKYIDAPEKEWAASLPDDSVQIYRLKYPVPNAGRSHCESILLYYNELYTLIIKFSFLLQNLHCHAIIKPRKSLFSWYIIGKLTFLHDPMEGILYTYVISTTPF